MKILFIFWDMARVDLLNTYSKNNKKTSIDDFLNKIGGTLYTKCYTPAPDTPRSLACMQTGLYPSKNGCDSRIKWPKFFLNKVPTIFDLINKQNFEQLFYMTKIHHDVGPFKKDCEEYGKLYHDNKLFINDVNDNLKTDKNLFTYISLQDYHWAIDDYGSNKRGVKKGQDQVVSYTNNFFKNVDIDAFDCIVTFSDHGHKMGHELLNENKLELLNGNRTQILMHIRMKNQMNLIVNNKLCSILDVYATLVDILKIKEDYLTDGISLLSKKEHENIVIEDHSNFDVSPFQGLSQWAYRKKNSLYMTNLEEDLYIKNGDIQKLNIDHKKRLVNAIFCKSPKILEYQKKLKVLEFYKTLREADQFYSDGLARYKGGYIFRLKNIMYKIYIKIKKRNLK
jgi:arylsulfatase A-like enzyme